MLQLDSWRIDEDSSWKRDGAEIPRETLPMDFGEKFDFRTFVYHAFDDGKNVNLICPKLMSLESLFEQTVFFADGVEVSASLHKYRQFDEIVIPVSGIERLRLENSAGVKSFTLNNTLSKTFVGLDTIVTVNKNAHLKWIEDFVNYHVLHHGAQALLIYDNGSTDYSVEDIRRLLATTALKASAVISVPFPYGPVLIGRDQRYQFLQTALLNISRKSFLQHASAVLSIDIDELVIPGKRSIFDVAKRSLMGMVRFSGGWRYCSSDENNLHLHSDHTLKVENENKCPKKYCYVPAGMLGSLPFDMHGLSVENSLLRKLLHFAANYSRGGYWHCAGITMHLRGKRPTTSDGVVVDTEMLSVVQRTWHKS